MPFGFSTCRPHQCDARDTKRKTTREAEKEFGTEKSDQTGHWQASARVGNVMPPLEQHLRFLNHATG